MGRRRHRRTSWTLLSPRSSFSAKWPRARGRSPRFSLASCVPRKHRMISDITTPSRCWGEFGVQARSTLPTLLADFKSLPPNDWSRDVYALALALIGRGTDREDEILTLLVAEWKTLTPKELDTTRSNLTRSLLYFGPKSVKLVPELGTRPLEPSVFLLMTRDEREKADEAAARRGL